MEKQIQAAAKQPSSVFADCELGSGFDEEFFLLNFGTRLLTSFTDRENLIDIALETLADFSRGQRIAILSLDESGKTLNVDGVFYQNQSGRPRVSFPVEGTVPGKWVSQKAVGVAPLLLEAEIPLPAEGGRTEGNQCLCLPLVGSCLRAVGLATIEIPADRCYGFFEAQQLRVLSTALAVSLENANLFSRVIHDGLTNLYTRRFYEIRIEEELAKLKRNNGHLSVILFDLDEFKKVNDSFGHMTGDEVLRRFATLMMDHARKGSTLVSRYGGEEFILLLPDSHVEEARHLAERITALCAEHDFGDDRRKIRITVSGGVAFTDHTQSVSPAEFFERADQALYEAKHKGRNCVVVWKNKSAPSRI
ncbi:MAG: sensor domain-containing diguanylate cyclase [Smithellaceae bacterium]|nr:sensor domain-containing diguanylate cyclase [Smithellaceae bacterium]